MSHIYIAVFIVLPLFRSLLTATLLCGRLANIATLSSPFTVFARLRFHGEDLS